MKLIRLGVHEIVDVVLRRGSINSSIFNIRTMQEGTKIHALYQKIHEGEFESEVYLETKVELRDYIFEISGRADGFKYENNKITIIEIKSSNQDIETFSKENLDWHVGQSIFYAYSALKTYHLNKAEIHLVYIKQVEDDEDYSIEYIQENSKVIVKEFNFNEVEEKMFEILEDYVEVLDIQDALIELRNNSRSFLEFPFKNYRPGQEQIMNFIKENIENCKNCYIEAPTGIGKTVSTLYPYLEAILDNEHKVEKIFYLTAKNSSREGVCKIVDIFRKRGFLIRTSSLCSKDKLCINEKKKRCNPDDCIYARNYYDKLRRALKYGIDRYSNIGMIEILEMAYRFEMCPFELQLDLSLFSDLIICDYNHVFDKNVQLQRFFYNKIRYPYYLLIDEVHNLPQRVRDIYSEEISIFDFFPLFKKEKGGGLTSTFKKNLKEVFSFFENYDVDKDKTPSDFLKRTFSIDCIDPFFVSLLNKLSNNMKTILAKQGSKVSDDFISLYTKINNFINVLKETEVPFSYFVYFDKDNQCIKFSIKCLDSTKKIENEIYKFESCTLFSATLAPYDYFLPLLCNMDKKDFLTIASPFKKENRCVLIDGITSLKYNDRDASLTEVYLQILDVISIKKGNYFVFLPSYEYLEKLEQFFTNRNDILAVFQKQNMSERDREDFLSLFVKNPQITTVGFLVLGGIFSEGIDLIEDRLIGSIIVSIGLPKVSLENNVLMDYYKTKFEDNTKAFMYAYTYPGISKVLQAAGRVIRSETDNGIIFFIDSRYLDEPYKTVLLQTYKHIDVIYNRNQASKIIKKFWEDKKDEKI